MILTLEQQNVIVQLQNWHKDTESKAICLQSPAGFGKTFVLAQYIQLQSEPVTVIAPTHAALAVLRQKLADNTPEGTKFLTVAKALAQFPVQSNFSMEINFGSFGGKPIEGLTIVDESSMLSEFEVNSLINLCDKVIFSGDNNQLAPVKKKSGYNALMELQQLTLTKMMRAESQSIVDAGFKCLTDSQFVPESSEDGTVVCHDSEAELKSEFLIRVKSEKPGNCVYITYTNLDVQEMNQVAHKAVTNRIELCSGDVVRLYASSKLGKNNALVEINTIESSFGGNYIVTTKPDGDDLGIHKVEVALPVQYKKIEQQIEAIVEQFNAGFGSDILADQLAALRTIVPIDFPYAISTHKSQGSSIPVVFANSQRLHGNKSFYVAYSRASQQLHVCKKIGKTKGVKVTGTTWTNLKTGAVLEVENIRDLQAVRDAISKISLEPSSVPSVSHLACCLNPSHASKSAKGWTLA